MSVTFVTALYDIGRGNIDGRDIYTYKNWLIKTLQTIIDPFILFLDSSFGWKEELLEIRRDIGPIKIIETPLEEIPMWKYKDRIQNILENPDFKRIQKHPNDITNKTPFYCMIQYSKFGFVESAIQENPFCTEYFSWIDAGFSRFYDTTKLYKFHTPSGIHSFHIDVDPYRLPQIRNIHEFYIGSNECILHGGIWFFDVLSFISVKEKIFLLWEEEMLQKSRIDNEQITLAQVYNTMPSLFTLIPSPYDTPFVIFSKFMNPV